MATYRELYLGDELEKLRDGLAVLDGIVDGQSLKDLDLYLFGIVHDTEILDAAKEVLSSYQEDYIDEDGNNELTTDNIELNEIAIAFPITGPKAIDILYGRGVNLKVYPLDFAYQSEGGEGVRTQAFSGLSFTTYLTINDMEVKALAETDLGLDDFLKQKGTQGAHFKIKREVSRDEVATPEETPPPIPPQGTPKKTSLKISHIMEDFLG